MNGNKRAFISEINEIRGLACLAVLIMHSINSKNYSMYLPEIEKLSLFATPVFLFISAFILFYNYQDGVPITFLSKRLKYILTPYILWSSIYTFVSFIKWQSHLPSFEDVLYNMVTGKFHIYFILIIMQFYFMFYLIQKIEWKKYIGSTKVLLAILVCNVVYLYIFNSTEQPSTYWSAFWKRYYFMLFPAWSFYFILGGYIALKYNSLKTWIHQHRKGITFLMIGSAVFILYTVHSPVTSKKPEIIIYTTAIILFLFMIFTFKKRTTSFLSRISPYSFGIYLSHPLFYKFFYSLYLDAHPWIKFIVNFSIQFFGALLLTYLLSKLPIGSFLIGHTKQKKKYHQKTFGKNRQVVVNS